jgi:hypothetical protein
LLKDYEKRVAYLRSVFPPYTDFFSRVDEQEGHSTSVPNSQPPAAPTDKPTSLGSPVVLSTGHFTNRGIRRAPDGATSRKIEETIRTTLEEKARRDLIGESAAMGDGLRNRGKIGGLATDVDAILSAHQEEQELVAEEMLHLARSLKEQSLAANRIIAKDRDVSFLPFGICSTCRLGLKYRL